MNKWLVTTTLALCLVSSLVHAAGNAEQGKNKSITCAACHGPDGNSPTNPLWPKIAGQHPLYIEKQIMDFKTKGRHDPTMSPQAQTLNEQDVADLAAYFSSQTLQGGEASKKLVEEGERIYRAGNPDTGVAACMACHGPAGAGVPQAKFPALAGQHAAYVEKTLVDFRDGNRKNDLNKMMQGVVERMTNDEIAAVAQYIQGLRR
jgi:cytochrome c553